MRAAIAFLFALAIYGAEATGIWTGQAPGRNGEAQDVTFNFRQSGDALTGKLYGDGEDTRIGDGKVSGDQISFTVASGFGQGKLLYTGTIQGGQMQLTRERPGGGAEKKEAAKDTEKPQSFSLKRMTP